VRGRRTELVLVCSDRGQHKRRRLAHLYLDVVLDDGATVVGITSAATGQQRGGTAPAMHHGERGKWRFLCSSCGRDVQVSDGRLSEVMDALAGPRVATLDVSSGATVL